VTRLLDTLRREDGMTLIEVTTVSFLLLIILGATLTTFNVFERNVKTNERQNEAQDQNRRALDLMARDLRNLASPTPELPYAVDLHQPRDVIFQSEGKSKELDSLNAQNTTRVRYCLNTDTRMLYRQIHTWKEVDPPAVPDHTACPGAGWTSTLVVGTDVTNGARPIFTYNSGTPDAITEVSAQVFVDVNPGRAPAEVNMQTAVFLRNQNRAPTAEFSWVPMPAATANQTGTIFLNASESVDPEEKALIFEWYDATIDSAGHKVGDGIVFTYPPPAPGPRQMFLIVRDSTLFTKSATQTVCATGTGETCSPTP
jgi:type II secretory pathway component PulJ